MQFWALVVDSFRESLDRKIFWVLVIVTFVIAVAMFCIGFDANGMTVMFGLWSAGDDPGSLLAEIPPEKLVGGVVWVLLSTILGWGGIALVIIATANVFPSMMEGGAIDVLISKPIGRVRLFLYKYVSSMVFVLLQAILFVVLTFLVMGVRWGTWRPGYLLAVPLLVLLFSYIFCVSVLAGIKTRSSVASILISIGAWCLFALIHQAPTLMEMAPAMKREPVLYHGLKVMSWIPPKTGDFDYLAAKWAGVGTSLDIMPDSMLASLPPQELEHLRQAQAIEERELLTNPVSSIGSSLLFEAVIVAWALMAFVRRDY